MHGFTDDKSKWNLGTWTKGIVLHSSIKPALAYDDEGIASNFPNKYIGVVSLGFAARKLSEALAAYPTPSLVWEVINRIDDGKELTELEQEMAAMISNVFFQNETIYVVFNKKPQEQMSFLFKGA